MKRIWLVVISLLAVVAVTATGCAVHEKSQTSPIPFKIVNGENELTVQPGVIFSQQQVGVWVNGDGKATAAPDIAIISLGVEAEKPTVDEAKREAAEAMDGIMKVLSDKGVDKKDIQTQQYMIYPVWQWNDRLQKQELVGYRVTNMVTVKVRKIDTAGEVIDAVAKAAGDVVRINNINFTVDDPEPYFKEAREKAVKNAQEKAAQMAAAAGIKLGALIYMSESTGYVPVYRDTYMKAEAGMPAPAVETPISPGELEYSVSVQMVYGMK
jgi:uncharacterized protein YggE